MAGEVIKIKTIGRLKVPIKTESRLVIPIKTIASFPKFPVVPVGTLTLNSIVISVAPGEVLFDFTASDADGTVAKIELLRKESAESVFTEVAEILLPGASGQITDLAVPEGTYEYKLLITDDEDLTGESNVVDGIVITSSVPAIIDWAGIPNQNLTVDGAVIPGTNGFMKIYLAGTATARIQSEKLELIQTAPQNSTTNYALAGHSQDLNTLRTGGAAGTWFIRYKVRRTSGIQGVGPLPLIVGRLATAADVTSPFAANEFTVWCDFVGTAGDLYVLRFQNLSAALAIFASSSQSGFHFTERIYTLEKTGGATPQYIWTIDEGGLDLVLLGNVALVNQPTSEFFYLGHITGGFNTRNDPTTTQIADEIEMF